MFLDDLKIRIYHPTNSAGTAWVNTAGVRDYSPLGDRETQWILIPRILWEHTCKGNSSPMGSRKHPPQLALFIDYQSCTNELNLRIYAFRSGRSFRFNPIAMLLFAVYGALIYVILLPGLNGMALPVASYIVVILTMVWQAWDQWDDMRARWALLAIIGAVLFVISDSLLALNRFWEPFTAARALTLSTYFSAQWLISNSNHT